jgi:hypothetical protein
MSLRNGNVRRAQINTINNPPAAGVDFSIEVPTDQAWSIISISAQLVTDANVANRLPILRIRSGKDSSILFEVPATLAQAASLTRRYNWLRFSPMRESATVATLDSYNLFFPPDIQLKPGWIIESRTLGIQATDQWGTQTILAWARSAKLGG